MVNVEFKCDKCGRHAESYFSMKEKYKLDCIECKTPMRRLYGLQYFKFDFQPHFNRGAGQYFDTKKQFNTYLRENNTRVVG